jgi:hypothetical protein
MEDHQSTFLETYGFTRKRIPPMGQRNEAVGEDETKASSWISFWLASLNLRRHC